MNFNRMRALLLEHAIQGKLVPQLDDEPDVEQIGKTREEVPFDIPKKWKWLPLKVVCKDFLVPMRDKPTFSNNQMDTPWCRIEDIVEGKYLRGSKSARFLSEKTIQDMNLKVNPVGTVISACSASIGGAAVVETQCCTNQTFIGLVCDEQHLFNWYLYFVLKSAKQRLVDIGTGTTIKYISRKKYEEFLIPVPSLSEQRRIVAKLEESFAEIARAEKAYEELQTLAGVLRGQILQEAIKGKLVPQLAEEGVVEHIGAAPDEVPFEIPESWQWVQLNRICTLKSGVDMSPSVLLNEPVVDSIPYITGGSQIGQSGELLITRWTSKATNISEKGDVLLICKGSGLGRTALNSYGSVHIARQIMAIRKTKEAIPQYLDLLLKWRWESLRSAAKGVIPGISRKDVLSLLVPLPPVTEQVRIVAKVDDLLKQVNALSG